VRTLAENMGTVITVWSGTYGVLKLADENNNLVSLWLTKGEESFLRQETDTRNSRKLPVPKYCLNSLSI
jgi:uncharacterized FlgJ-related protein